MVSDYRRLIGLFMILLHSLTVQSKFELPLHRRKNILLSRATNDVSQKGGHVVMARTFLSKPTNDRFRLLGLHVRGGSGDEDDLESDESDGDDGDSANADGTALDLTGILEGAANITQSTVLPYTKKAVIAMYKFTKKVAITTVLAVQRAIKAGLEGDEESDETEEQEITLVEKVVATIQRMIKAALTFPTEDDQAAESTDNAEGGVSTVDNDDDNDDDHSTSTADDVKVEEKPPTTTTPLETKEAPAVTKPSDFGTYLATAYGVKDTRTKESGAMVLGGSLTTALQEARAQARMLVVFLPAEKPNKKSSDSNEYIAIESILSPEVGEAANQRARSKGEDTGSFLFWGAKVGSAEASTAIKRLKVKPKTSKGGKVPTLLVVYPAMVVDSATGQSKLVPNVVAQHHCSPPPSSVGMVGWLNSLRKRHAKQYTAMQTVLKELQYFKERTAGYKDSAKNDKERELQAKKEEEQRLAAEKAEQERLEALETRRKELLAALPEEPTGKDTKKIALRFFDGRSGQRQFNPEQLLSDVFNWVDAMYEMEREKVILTTMNGKNTFTWGDKDKSLDELGLGKNVGFRVSIKDEEDEDSQKSDT